MNVVEAFPYRVREIENVWIELADGCRLAARIWLPEDAEARPVPAILEYLPYRKRDFTRARDEPMHHYFAGYGYAVVRVDLRGSGDSGGVLVDEYAPGEQDDALEVIAWLARQPWCSGAVGMLGISWGGFNALQVAARDPPALKAIIALCASDDRYADDAHYMGGCLLNENQSWGSVLLSFNAYPPDPLVVGERWREMWMQRLESATLFPAVWLEHQRRDAYWKHGSVREDYARIRCAVYAIGGWTDGYSNAVPRLLEGLEAPRKGLIGPWAHVFPHEGVPGPAIGFLQEAVRWWDHWLKGRDSGLMDEPMYRVWLQDSVPPQSFYDHRPGRWIAEPAWPSGNIRERVLYPSPGGLAPAPAQGTALRLQSPQTTGLGSGDWCAFGADGEMPLDQRADDGRSLCFDGAALDAPLEILGAPVVELELECDRPQAMIAARLNDLSPDGASTRVSYGLLNLAHRDGHERPEPLVPGRRYRVRLQLNDIAHRFAAGHALRLALSTSYWPIAWPAPEPVALTLHTAGCRLLLPERPPLPSDASLREFPPPERAPGMAHTPLRRATFKRSVERDLATHDTVYTLYNDGGDFEGASIARIEAIGLELGNAILKRFIVNEGDPLSARAELTNHTLFRREGWQVDVYTFLRLSCDARNFRLEARLEAREGAAVAFSRDWDVKIARDCV
ncbi:MAG TPA: CocE/NonD family hydrolase [Gammaproteobacteria bacterium]|nr:CocE/NonD family hydrolase [Gammaproteobacteria bacterium]